MRIGRVKFKFNYRIIACWMQAGLGFKCQCGRIVDEGFLPRSGGVQEINLAASRFSVKAGRPCFDLGAIELPYYYYHSYSSAFYFKSFTD